jgi:RNA-directed DNA polymerase
MAKGNPQEPPASRTQGRTVASSGLERVRQAAKRDSTVRFTALLHHLTLDRLRDSYNALKRDAAAGVDDVTWRAYSRKGVEAQLRDLHDRVHSGRYRAKPSKRTYLPKPDGRERPIGIAALEDKIVQQAARWVLEAIWEEDFANFSYGFRPKRSQHSALDALWVAITQRKVSWVLDADVRSFFDTLDHEWLMKFVERRVADPRMLRLIRKWLRAGVSEDGQWSRTTVGVPQGAVISPLLANIYLHYVLDQWVKRWRNSQARGEVIIVRYADDFVMGFQYRDDAERFRQDLQERLARPGTPPGQNPPDRIRPVRYREPEETRGGQAGNLRLSGIHAHLRETPEGRKVHGATEGDPQTNAREVEGHQRDPDETAS